MVVFSVQVLLSAALSLALGLPIVFWFFVEARRRLATSKLEAVLCGSDSLVMPQQCRDAESLGVNAHIIARVRTKAANIQNSITEIETAKRGGDPVLINRACSRAQASGVHASTVAAARRVAELLLNLQTAKFSGDHEHFERICNDAANGGLDKFWIAAAREEAALVRAAIDKLDAVWGTSDCDAMDRACDEAAVVGVDKGMRVCTFTKVRQKAQAIRSAAAMLESIRYSGQSDMIEEACEQAEAAGVDAHMVAAIREEVDLVRKVMLSLDIAQRSGNIEHM